MNFEDYKRKLLEEGERQRLSELQTKYNRMGTPDYSTMSTRDELQTRFDLQKLNELQQKYGTQQMQTPVRTANYNTSATSSSAQPNVGVWPRLLQTFTPISTANAAKPIQNSNVDYSKYGDGFSKEYIDGMLADKRFQRALNEYAFPNEGGYVNDPNDSGGETNMGISKHTYPNEDIENLTRERANAILYRDFWKWNGIHTLPDEIVGVVFDNAINGVPLTAIRNAHRALGIAPGNIIGNETREKIKNVDLAKFLADYQEIARAQRYETVKKRPKDKVYLNNWLNRINGWHLSPQF